MWQGEIRSEKDSKAGVLMSIVLACIGAVSGCLAHPWTSVAILLLTVGQVGLSRAFESWVHALLAGVMAAVVAFVYWGRWKLTQDVYARGGASLALKEFFLGQLPFLPVIPFVLPVLLFPIEANVGGIFVFPMLLAAGVITSPISVLFLFSRHPSLGARYPKIAGVMRWISYTLICAEVLVVVLLLDRLPNDLVHYYLK